MAQRPQGSLKSVRMVHLALGVSVLIFTAVSVLIYSQKEPAEATAELNLQAMLAWSAAAGLVMSLGIGSLVGKLLIKAQKSRVDDVYKARYQIFITGHLIRLAMMESCAMLAAVSFFLGHGSASLTSVESLVALGTIGLFELVWVVTFPTEERVCKALELPFDAYTTG
jgi:hypothetical protein